MPNLFLNDKWINSTFCVYIPIVPTYLFIYFIEACIQKSNGYEKGVFWFREGATITTITNKYKFNKFLWYIFIKRLICTFIKNPSIRTLYNTATKYTYSCTVLNSFKQINIGNTLCYSPHLNNIYIQFLLIIRPPFM